jgi:RimJ/RimL family protein N-acetyltransferase
MQNPEIRRQTVLDGGRVAGYVASWPHEGKRLIAYWLGRGHWGRGIASAALREFLRTCERARPLHAYVAVQNPASQEVLRKCGFQRVGEAAKGRDGVEELLVELV